MQYAKSKDASYKFKKEEEIIRQIFVEYIYFKKIKKNNISTQS